MIEKDLTNDKMNQPYYDHVVMENNGKNSRRYPCDGLHLEKNNSIRVMKIILLSHIRKNLLWSRKKGR